MPSGQCIRLLKIVLINSVLCGLDLVAAIHFGAVGTCAVSNVLSEA